MRVQCRTFIFGVVLHADKPRMVFQFDDLDQVRIRIYADRFEACLDELVQVVVIEFVTVAMAFDDLGFPVCRIDFLPLCVVLTKRFIP